MNLIDRYVNAVADRLPEKMREDLSKEIRSLIEDTLDDRAAQTGKSPNDETLVTEVLKSFGSPRKNGRFLPAGTLSDRTAFVSDLLAGAAHPRGNHCSGECGDHECDPG